MEDPAVKVPPLPPELKRLDELAFNLWWSWHPEARALFKALDSAAWKMSDHNPIKVLQQLTQKRLEAAAQDPVFLNAYRTVMSRFDADLGRPAAGPLTAYLSPEFAVDATLPTYSGGLGVLAGDHIKEASDLAIPIVGVSFVYSKGYFHQRLLPDGWQQALDEETRWLEIPLKPVLDAEGRRLSVAVPLADREVRVAAWRLEVGRSVLFLLDTDLPENRPEDRELSARLYPGHPETQLRQHVVHGIAAVRLLHALRIEPEVWHANEAHTGFFLLERMRLAIARGLPFEEALKEAGRPVVFTTHTPLLHGSARFPREMVAQALAPFFTMLGVDRERFLDLGAFPGDPGTFILAALLLRAAGRSNGVSKRHGEVAREMWRPLWPEREPAAVPIAHVTNGVHLPTWISGEMYGLLKRQFGPDWLDRHDDPIFWRLLDQLPDEEYWQTRTRLKEKLLSHVLDVCRKRWVEDPRDPAQVIAMGSMLDARALTIGFCRRFTAYKRPLMIFRDLERLKRLLNDRLRPVQIIFAGKSHPEDKPGHELAQRVYQLAKDPSMCGRVAFVEDYDMHTAQYLVQGVDVWLNNPIPGQEASGTSGMKAAMNGVPQLSVLDGWWVEGYEGNNGWAVEGGSLEGDFDWRHAQAVYELLEREVIPTFYDHNLRGVPVRWVGICKKAMAVSAVRFSARRMVREYLDNLYRAPRIGTPA